MPIKRHVLSALLATTLSTSLLARPTGAAEAAATPFPTLWSEVDSHSHARRSAELGVESARAAERGASRHWLPRVYLDGRAFGTNDPALSFMSILGQRQIEAQDFAPSALNDPGSAIFGRATLGVDLPLYEGGAGKAGAEAAHHQTRARESERQAARDQLFAETFAGYGTVLALRSALGQADELSTQVRETLSRYQLGASSNPVGHSGLLGLQALANRLSATQGQWQAQERSARAALADQAETSPDWRPESATVESFVDRYGATARTETPVAVSAQTRALQSQAASAENQGQVARGATLPKVGLFTEGNLMTGNRNTATSYSAGAYVSWNIYSPKTDGASDEARLRGEALREQAEASAQRDRAETGESSGTIEVLRRNLPLLRKNSELLAEQVRTGKRLFASGSINALQLTEIYARSLDVIEARAQAELAYLAAYRNLILHSGKGTFYATR